jgi:hypothetical protein
MRQSLSLYTAEKKCRKLKQIFPEKEYINGIADVVYLPHREKKY